MKVLTQQNYIHTNDSGNIAFDDNFSHVAQYANLVLDDVTLQMLQHITSFTDEELKAALDAVAAQNAKRRLKRKSKTTS